MVLDALLERLAEGGPDGPLGELDFEDFMAALGSEESDADVVEPPPAPEPAVAGPGPEPAVADPPLPPPCEPPPPVVMHSLPWYTCYVANGGKLS